MTTTTENTESDEFTTTDIELSSAIQAVTGRRPSIFRETISGFGAFTHKYSDQVQDIILSYSAGSLVVNCRAILMARRGLFRDLKALPRDGVRP